MTNLDTWKCKHCGCEENWFDRTISYDAEGNEIGMKTRCAKCGRADDE